MPLLHPNHDLRCVAHTHEDQAVRSTLKERRPQGKDP